MGQPKFFTGRIKKIFGGYYEVISEQGLFVCKTRGNLHQKELFTGDEVLFAPTEEQKGIIESIFPRQNFMLQPNAANISNVIVIATIKEPAVSLEVIDRFLVLAAQYTNKPILCINKADLLQKPDLTQIKKIYQQDYLLVFTSCLTQQGLSEFKKLFSGKISVLTGPSGVGKSSLLNALDSSLQLKTGEVSDKNKHGKHTTRHTELLPLDKNSFVIDTPGFSLLEIDLPKENLASLFFDLSHYQKDCKFNGCLHQNEPQCAVKNAVEKGELPLSRYASYVKILAELQYKEKNQYKRDFKQGYRKGSSTKWKK